MSTVEVTLTDGSLYEMSIDNMTSEMVFELLREGRMTFEQFEEYRSSEYFRGYQDGQEFANNY